MNDIVWLRAKDAMTALGVKSESQFYRLCYSGKIKRRKDDNPAHNWGKYVYAVPRHLWESVNPTIPMKDATSQGNGGAEQLLSEEQIERIAKSFSSAMKFVIADELRKVTCSSTADTACGSKDNSSNGLSHTISKNAEAIARRIGFDSVEDAIEDLQSVKISKSNANVQAVVITSFERRIHKFNEENDASVTLRDVADDYELLLAVCFYRATHQRPIRARDSVRQVARCVLTHFAENSTPAAQ